MSSLRSLPLKNRNQINLLICKVIDLKSQFNHTSMNKKIILNNKLDKVSSIIKSYKQINIIKNRINFNSSMMNGWMT
jgi:hypothetical protein